MKEQVIQLPDNLEVKEIKDGKIILVEKKKKLTYEDIAKKLNYVIPLNCTSNKQTWKLFAINRLMNVAKYLNGDWQPDWDNKTSSKYYIRIDSRGIIYVTCIITDVCGDIYFKSKKLAQQAIEILGEETIRLALCTDY